MRLSKYCRNLLPPLIQAIKNREVLTYGELAERAGHPGKTLAIPNALGTISEFTYNEIGVFITVVVVNDKTRCAGPGFIQMVSNVMGLDEVLSDDFLRHQMKAVHAISHHELDKLLM